MPHHAHASVDIDRIAKFQIPFTTSARLLTLTQRLVGSVTNLDTAVPIVSVLAVIGSVMVVSAGFWDAISHMLQEPEYFWSPSHVVVYLGVSATSCGAVLGGLLLRRHAGRLLRTGVRLIILGSAVQIVSGLGDSISHDMFGIDGLISWSHQPLEAGLVMASLGAVLIVKTRRGTRLDLMLPFAITTFLFLTTWLAFNLVLVFGHTIQCIPVYEIFSSGCAVL